MNVTLQTSTRTKTCLWYTLSAFLPILLLIPLLRLDRADLSICFDYEMLANPDARIQPSGGGDAYFMMMLFRSMSLHGSAQSVTLVGAPHGLDMRDHPILDSLQLTIARILCLFADYGQALNAVYLLGFALTSACMMFALRCLGIRPPLAMAAGVVYSFLPYHFLRGQGHLFLGFYPAIPLVILTAIWIATGQLDRTTGGTRHRAIIKKRRWIAALAALAIACSGAYYAVFALYIFAAAGLIAVWQRRSLRSASASVVVIGLAALVFAANAAPFLVYANRVGPNPTALLRHPAEAEVFAFKPIQLLLPIDGHRVDLLASAADAYNNYSTLITENRMAALGFIGSIGFLMLLMWPIGLRWQTARPRTLTAAAQLNLFLLALGTMGGVGSIIAYGISPTIRSYGRVSVMIAALSLIPITLLLQTWILAWCRNSSRKSNHPLRVLRWRHRDTEVPSPSEAASVPPCLCGSIPPVLLWIAAIILILIGTLDQTSSRFIPLHEQNAAAYASDRAFVQKLEAQLPPKSMVFQLPYVQFPEAASPAPYELFRPYFHSASLRWSFGAMKGRKGDGQTREIMTLIPDANAFLGALRTVGYAGIYLDKALDEGEKLEIYLRTNLGQPQESPNRRLLFFNLRK